MIKTIVAMFHDTADARRAVNGLTGAGYPKDGISAVLREHEEGGFSKTTSLLTLTAPNQATTTPMDRHQVDLPGVWSRNSLSEPGYGPLIAAGPLAQGIGGAALGVAAGGAVGALSDIGIPNHVGRDLIDRVRTGKEMLIAIRVEREECEKVEKVFLDNGAHEVYRSADNPAAYVDGARPVLSAERGF
ncbi:MAG TPA: hypothetical protein PKK84_03785 [Armatimonadota bacterium]|jgi:hypothetical protein|nr:hypothetical protein [Armatimonadota bacterium]